VGGHRREAPARGRLNVTPDGVISVANSTVLTALPDFVFMSVLLPDLSTVSG